jgi:hypothetical protein
MNSLGSGGMAPPFFISALDGGSSQLYVADALHLVPIGYEAGWALELSGSHPLKTVLRRLNIEHLIEQLILSAVTQRLLVAARIRFHTAVD